MRRVPIEVIPAGSRPRAEGRRNAVWTTGRLTARWRELPDFLVIGAQKAGTTALYAYLRWHPAIAGPFWKEVSFFDRHWARGRRGIEASSRCELERQARRRGEPELRRSTRSPRSGSSRSSPTRKLIVLLREPGDRAYSQYQHAVALGRETLSFEDALAAEDERVRGEVERLRADPKAFSFAWWNHTYAARGLYADQLERWLALFPREQLLVVTTEELGARPEETYASVLAFLGAPPHALDAYPRVFDRDYPPMREETRHALTVRFAEPNRRLEDLLGRPLGWPAP